MKVLLTASFLLSAAAIGLGFAAATMHAKARATSVGSAEPGAIGAESDVPSSSTMRAAVRTLATSSLNHPAPAAPEPPPPDRGPREPPQTAAEEREATIARLRASGPDGGRFAAGLGRVKDEWSSVARSVGAKLGDWECHAAGCFSNVSAANEGKAETMNEVVTRLPSFHEWPGSKLRTGIESADGGVEYSWFLFAADETAAGQPSRGDGT